LESFFVRIYLLYATGSKNFNEELRFVN